MSSAHPGSTSDREPAAPDSDREPAASGVEPWSPPIGTRLAGLAGLAVAVTAWAYTLTILTPRMPIVADRAPMPGGDGELFLWVAELRWAAILLAALSLLTALAHRRGALLLAAGTGTLLLGVDGAVERAGLAGSVGLAVTLGLGAAVLALAGRLARWRAPGIPAHVVRRRLAIVAVAAACCAPLPLAQGTPGVNHPFLPAGLPLVTAVLPVFLVVLAAFAVGAARHRPPRPLVPLAGALLPAAVLGGFGTATGAGVEPGNTSIGVLLAVPLGVVVVALLRLHRPDRRTVALWTGLTLAGLPGTVPLVIVSVVVSIFVSAPLFALAGTSYPADGVAVLPAAALLALVAGGLIAPLTVPHSGQPSPAAAPPSTAAPLPAGAPLPAAVPAAGQP
ncbi:hypothetical protein [Plantactinospora sp. BB1]|uniref:hypothetical protein n=1 Tax=Plantactinospora sp. BB1 TaxID=2071627 RepID=UPI000D15FFBD|nr:hypothetical protein [Plantactinospora sp. BB1]AVT36838.1 hypothetical protein C6W10_10540 [Plantactinospora sp. BB1]